MDLDYHLVHDAPTPLFMGELPRRLADAPARVVVNLCGVVPPDPALGRIVLTFGMLDALDPELLPPRDLLEHFVDAAHAFADRVPTYWHCHAGINRSGLAVATYLHRHRGMRISEAISQLRTRRTPMVLCNNVFEEHLRGWYGDEDEQDFEPFALQDYLVERLGRR